MRNTLALVAGLIAFAAAIPYIIDTIKGKTHPNVVTWGTWTLLNVINVAATLNSGAIQTALLAAFTALGTGTIAILGIKKGVKKYTALDIVCQALAIAGIIAWILTDNAAIAIAIAQFVILAAAVPTWHHAWISPFAETWEGFAIALLAGTLTLFSVSTYNFTSIASPLVFLLNSAVIVSIVLIRRKLHPELTAKPG